MENESKLIQAAEDLSKVNSLITEFLRPIGDISVRLGLDFCYEPDDNGIVWTFLGDDKVDNIFNDFFERELDCPVINNFIYSIFHEVGHFMTWKNFTKHEQNIDYYWRSVWEDEPFSVERDNKYFHLPTEIAASKWAVDYIKNHYAEIINWTDHKLAPALGKALVDYETAIELAHIIKEIQEE